MIYNYKINIKTKINLLKHLVHLRLIYIGVNKTFPALYFAVMGVR